MYNVDKARSYRGKDKGSMYKNLCAGLLMLSPSQREPQRVYTSTSNKNAATCITFCLGKPTGNSAFTVFIGTGHVDTLCISCTKIPDSQKKSRRSALTP
jgi:hypothetical protein